MIATHVGAFREPPLQEITYLNEHNLVLIGFPKLNPPGHFALICLTKRGFQAPWGRRSATP
jgi:hypothetical protein